jgi:acetate kinase
MKQTNPIILTINGGSSSIKFALFKIGETLERILYGKIDRIGLKGTNLTFKGLTGNQQGCRSIESSDHKSAANFLIDWLEEQEEFALIKTVGHRIVHGMNHTGPEIITRDLLAELHTITSYDPDHLPDEIELIEVFQKRHPSLVQAACFDTSFHCTMPRVSKLLPIPRRFELSDIRRYGFHGLSYAYLIEELARLAGTQTAGGRVIIAHLGNGASLAAIHEGKSIDTSMGFTPAGGLVMGTRPGDLDPGVAWYMMKAENLTPKQFNKLINHDSGLLGISGSSSDMRDLLAKETSDVKAAEAVELFCYQTKKWIGSFAAVLGGLDTLIFSGGIGENCPLIRSRICQGLEFLGIDMDEKANMSNDAIISKDKGRAIVRVIHTDEELMIAKTVYKITSPDISVEKRKSKYPAKHYSQPDLYPETCFPP